MNPRTLSKPTPAPSVFDGLFHGSKLGLPTVAGFFSTPVHSFNGFC